MLLIKKTIREKFDNPETSLFECECLIQECEKIGFNELANEMKSDLEFVTK